MKNRRAETLDWLVVAVSVTALIGVRVQWWTPVAADSRPTEGPMTSALDPGTSADGQSTSARDPSASDLDPVASAPDPSASDLGPATSAQASSAALPGAGASAGVASAGVSPTASPSPTQLAPPTPRSPTSHADALPAMQAPHWDQVILPTRVALPTRTPSPGPTPSPAPTWEGWAGLLSMPPLESVPRARGSLARGNAANGLDPASLPSSLVGVHFAGHELTAAELVAGVEAGNGAEAGLATWEVAEHQPQPGQAWSVELVYTSDHRFDEQIVQELIDRHDRGFRIILRVDYERKQPVPAADDSAAVLDYVNTFLKYYDLTEGRIRYFVMGNEGNVDAPGDEPGRVTECLAGRHTCSAANFAEVYRQVRWALRSRTDAYLLVGATSPGTTERSPRWMDGYDYLADVLGRLHPLEVDGVTLHAYGHPDGALRTGSSLDHFAYQVERQIDVIREAGMISTPLFLTEINQGARPDPGFVGDVLRWVHAHNARSEQDILAACWFVYYDETGEWRQHALEHHPDALEAMRVGAGFSVGR